MDAIPFEVPGRQIPFVILEAQINGQSAARMLLDTGAAAPFTIIISPGLADRARVRITDGQADIPSTGAVGATAVGFKSATVAQFRLGDIKLRNVSAGVTPALEAVSQQLRSNIDGIVGYQFVKGRRISIDYKQRRVDFSARGGRPASAIPFTLAPKRSLTLVQARINGRGPFLLALDTAASATLVSPDTAAVAGLSSDRGVRLAGAGGASPGGAAMTQASIGLQGLTRERQSIAIADVLDPVRAASGAPIQGILGADFLSNFKVTVDYKTQQLWLEESGHNR